MGNETEIKSPVRLAHVVLRTSQLDEMVAWYKKVLNASEAFNNGDIAFLAYDDEHHRVAFIKIPELDAQPAGTTGVHHVAFTFDGLTTLLGNYERLRDEGIKPVWPVNHGPTTSLYYQDPDGNQIEFQVDNYDTVEEAGEYFFSKEFKTNPIGVDFDPEEMLRKLRAGEDESALKMRPQSGPRGVESIPLT
jgi:catechol-2,3-dioxygenase